MNKLESGKAYKFTYCEIEGGEEIKNQVSIDLTYAEICNLKVLL